MAITHTKTPTAMRILRFDRVQRTAHWTNAALFGILMFTAIPLYFGSFFGIVFPRHLIEEIHLWSGIALPLPVILSMTGPWGKRMRHDLRRFNYWTHDEVRWLRSFAKTSLAADKFNPGQKLNAIFIGASIVITLATGLMLQWFRFFPVSWRVGATFVHDFFAYAIFAVVIGHIYMALTRRDPLRAIFTGWISEKWAGVNAASWLQEEKLTKESQGTADD